jgi:ABC-2 type transport system permease protein
MIGNYIQMLKLVAIDALFVVIAGLLLAPLANFKRAAFAVLKRNFVGYFANPTGYVFLCLFVFLTSAAAFWPHDFFIANLANLDQLNKYIPLILLVFVPAITMSLWADERRQGTDELLLTLPAADFDIVIGKYLAAAAIFTVSLMFSQIWNYWLLVQVASDPATGQVDLDAGLFFVTYLGYWLLGMAMLAIGMVASFLTSNLTVSFILGVLFNALPVMTYYADVLVPASATARQISQWSFAAQFDDLGRGVISLSSVAFFVLIIVLGIYLSMVLIGKRHWLRHDATPASLEQKVLALAGLVVAIPSLIALGVAPALTAEAGTLTLVGGLVGTALGCGLYWAAGARANPPHSGSMAAHYTVRTLTLVVALIAINLLLRRYDLRYDATQGKVSSLSPDTKRILQEVTTRQKRPIYVDAYISAFVPEEYVKVRYSLVAMLKELERQGGGRLRVRLHDNLELFSEAAAQAEQRFGIQRQRITTQARGALKEEEFIMGVAFTCGLEKVVLPSFKLGMPVEYELIRSIATVAGDQRKKLGVLKTDAEMMGGFSFQGMQPRQIPRQLILEELERQYKVEEVDPTNPIEPGRYDVILAVQPSTLGPPQLNNFVEAIRKGQPAVIFEDPFPLVMAQAVGTNQPKPPMGGMFGMGGPPPEKGDIRALWNTLEIQVTGDEGELRSIPGVVVWQDYNPYPRFQGRAIGPELVFIRNDMPDNRMPFNPDAPVVANFEEVLFPYPTGLSQKLGAKLKMTELVRTSEERSGVIDVSKLQAANFDSLTLELERGRPTRRSYILAAWIQGPAPLPSESSASSQTSSGAEGGKLAAQGVKITPTKATAGEDPKEAADTVKTTDASDQQPQINVIYVGDIDVLSSEFVRMRNEPNSWVVRFRFDNVPFVCNLIDAVAGETRFLEIRKRKPRHSTLRMVEARAAEAREREQTEINKSRQRYEEEEKKADEEAKKVYADLQKVVDDLQAKQRRGEEVDLAELEAKVAQLQIKRAFIERQLNVTKERLKRERDQELAAIERKRDQEIQRIQNEYKIQATVFPPILPLLVGLVVWTRRRIREREGISRARMRTA